MEIEIGEARNTDNDKQEAAAKKKAASKAKAAAKAKAAVEEPGAAKVAPKAKAAKATPVAAKAAEAAALADPVCRRHVHICTGGNPGGEKLAQHLHLDLSP